MDRALEEGGVCLLHGSCAAEGCDLWFSALHCHFFLFFF